jgi:hypothetical protein
MSDNASQRSYKRDFALPLAGSIRRASLRMPQLEEMLLFWLPASTQDASRAAVLFPAEIERVLDTLDGHSVDIATARSIFADPAAFAAYLQARNLLLEAGNDSGVLFAQCPHCRQWEADLTPLALAVGLHCAFWPTVEANRFLSVPALASDLMRPQRPGADVLTSRLRFELPSARLGLEAPIRGGAFSTDGVDARAAAFDAQREALRRSGDDAYDDWDGEFAGARALVRLCAVLADLDGDAGKVSLERIAALALSDFIFVDNAYYLTHHLAVPDDSPLRLTCPRCSGRFVPVQ